MTKKVVKKHGLHRKPPVKKVVKETGKVQKPKVQILHKQAVELEKKHQEEVAELAPLRTTGKEDAVNQKIQDLAKALSDKAAGLDPERLMKVTVKVKGRAKPYNDKKARMPAGTELRQGYDGENWHGSLTADGIEVHASNRAFAVMVRGLFEAYNERINPPTGDSA